MGPECSSETLIISADRCETHQEQTDSSDPSESETDVSAAVKPERKVGCIQSIHSKVFLSYFVLFQIRYASIKNLLTAFSHMQSSSYTVCSETCVFMENAYEWYLNSRLGGAHSSLPAHQDEITTQHHTICYIIEQRPCTAGFWEISSKTLQLLIHCYFSGSIQYFTIFVLG